MSAISVLAPGPRPATMFGVELSTDSQTDKRIAGAPFSDITYKIIGAAMRVHGLLGPGLKEAFYQRALSAELAEVGLDATAEQSIEISIGGTYIGRLYLDHLVEGEVVVEEKSVPHLLTNEEIAQLITYLNATGKPVGLLLNFGRRSLEYRRIFRPRNALDWTERIRRYVWLPPDLKSVYPLKKSVDSRRPQ